MTTTANSNSKQRQVAIFSVIIAALLIVNGILLFSWLNQKKVSNQTTAELEETEKLKQELEAQYDQALAELETMRTSNEELNGIIDQQKAELKDSKDKIERLLKNEGDLTKARQELKKLRGQVDQYIAEINNLKQQNQYLTEENTTLTSENQTLSTDLETTKMANEELNQAKTTLASENEKLSGENKNLTKTVNFASVVKVKEVDVTGYKTKDSGKPVKKTNADNVDQLKVCFHTTVNEVAKPGKEVFFVRIINPVGETLAIEELGSGIMTSSRNDEMIRYTAVKEYDYAQDETQLCLLWEPNVPFQKGTYEVEIYNKGFLAGSGTFTLK